MRTAILSLIAMNGFVLAAILARVSTRQPAVRLLALLLALISWRLGPYVLGYGGAYDRHPELTFLPFDATFAFGPLFWMAIVRATTGSMPERWRWHFAPAAVQVAYQVGCFALPLEAKSAWYAGPHLALVEPIGTALGLVLGFAYLAATWLRLRRYRAWLDSAYANREAARFVGLEAIMVAFAAMLAVSAAFAFAHWWIRPLDYFDRFPVVLVFGFAAYALGLIGLRLASTEVLRQATPAESPNEAGPPHPAESPGDPLAPASVGEREPAEDAYRRMGEAWRDRLIAEAWWRDEALDLDGLARRLQRSPRTVSRVLADGLGVSFRTLLNDIRVDAVCTCLSDPTDARPLLEIAFEAGFNSKASFNRAFRDRTGTTPSAFRERARAGLEIRQKRGTAETAAN